MNFLLFSFFNQSAALSSRAVDGLATKHIGLFRRFGGM